MSAAAVAAAARKRPAPDQEPCAADANKRPRYGDLRSIDEFEVFEVLGEGAEGVVRRARDRRIGKQVALKWIRGDGPGGHGPPRPPRARHGGRLPPRVPRPPVDHRDRRRRRRPQDRRRASRPGVDPGRVEPPRLHPEDLLGGRDPLDDEAAYRRCEEATRQKPDGKPHEAHPVGTLQYNSPEMLDGNWYYGPAIDMWGLGCIMAELLSGETLFQAESEDEMTAEMSELRDKMTSAVGKLDPACLADLSEDGSDVLTRLLAFCPEKRLTAAEALEHRWFNNLKTPLD